MQDFLQFDEIARGEHVEVMIDDFQRLRAMRCRGRQRFELQLETLAKIARADTRRIQVLQMSQRDQQVFDLDVEFGRQDGDEFGQVLVQIPVIVERIDEQRDELLVVFRDLRQRQLRDQVLAQRLRLGGNLRILGFVVVVCWPQRTSREAVALKSPANGPLRACTFEMKFSLTTVVEVKPAPAAIHACAVQTDAEAAAV